MENIKILLLENGLNVLKVFHTKGDVVYLELCSAYTLDKLYLYVPVKYNIKISDSDWSINCEITDIDIEGNDFTSKRSDRERKTLISDLENLILSSSSGKSRSKQSHSSEEKYDNIDDDVREIGVLVEYIKSLLDIVQNIPYKIVISYGLYIVTIHRENSIRAFKIIEQDDNVYFDRKSVSISIDLENIYRRIELSSLHKDMDILTETLSKITENNIKTQLINMSEVIQKNSTSFNSFLDLNKKRIECKQAITNLLSSMDKTLSMERENKKKQENIRNSSYKNSDMTTTLSVLEKESVKLENIKHQIIDGIRSYKNLYNSMTLLLDTISSENNIHMYSISSNFELFNKFIFK